MRLPDNLQFAGGAPMVNNVSAQTLGLPALGAGRRYRVWKWSAGIFAAAPAAGTHFRFALANNVGSAREVIDFFTGGGNCGGERTFPGGLVWPVNDVVTIFGISSIAGAVQCFNTVCYTVEAA